MDNRGHGDHGDHSMHYCFDCDETIASLGILKMYMSKYPEESDAYNKMISILATENTGIMRPGLGKFLRKLVRQNGGKVSAGIYTRNKNTDLLRMIVRVMHIMEPGLHITYILQIDNKIEKTWDLLAETYAMHFGHTLNPQRIYYYDDTMYTNIRDMIGANYICVKPYILPLRKEYYVGFYERYVGKALDLPRIDCEEYDDDSDTDDEFGVMLMNSIKDFRKKYVVEEDACSTWPTFIPKRNYSDDVLQQLFTNVSLQ
jgi:hypothetical protein